MTHDKEKPDLLRTFVDIRNLSANELMDLGGEGLAYVKPVVVNGTHLYAIHAADGQKLALAQNRDLALATVRDNDMEPLSVH